jgi:anoctamin-4
VFNTSHYDENMGADKDDEEEVEPETCQYRGYRNGPDHPDPYGLSPQYWHVFAARLAFVVVFEVFLEFSFLKNSSERRYRNQ